MGGVIAEFWLEENFRLQRFRHEASVKTILKILQNYCTKHARFEVI